MTSSNVEMMHEDYAGATLQLSGPRSYRVDGEGKVWVDPKNVLELLNLGFWPVAHVEPANQDYDPGDLTVTFRNGLV